jgi:Domain of unknown function (DUF4111)
VTWAQAELSQAGYVPPTAVLSYVGRLAADLADVSGGLLLAGYVHGSAALGGWLPGRSDVDALFIGADELASPALDRMARTLLASAADCPGRELESSIVTAAQAASPDEPWPYLAHVVARRGASCRVYRPGSRSPGDADLAMHYAVCRAAGVSAYGPPPRELIGTVARRVILGYLAGDLGWGAEHGSEAYAVLNACRALIYLTDGQIVSKLAGGAAALERKTGPADVLRRALDQQRGSSPDRPPGPDALDFVLAAAAALRAAAEGPW